MPQEPHRSCDRGFREQKVTTSVGPRFVKQKVYISGGEKGVKGLFGPTAGKRGRGVEAGEGPIGGARTYVDPAVVISVEEVEGEPHLGFRHQLLLLHEAHRELVEVDALISVHVHESHQRRHVFRRQLLPALPMALTFAAHT